MLGKDISDALGDISEEMLEQALYIGEQKPRKSANWLRIVAVAAAVAIILTALSFGTRFPKIYFPKLQTLGPYEDDVLPDATVTVNVSPEFPAELPIYRIKAHDITQKEYNQILNAIGFCEDTGIVDWSYHDLYIGLTSKRFGTRKGINEKDWTEEKRQEITNLAWDIFNSIPCSEGEFRCDGAQISMTHSYYSKELGSDVKEITQASVTFLRVLDGIPVTGVERYTLYFDDIGLLGISLRWYDYAKIGTMDVVPLENAVAQIKDPDLFSILEGDGKATHLAVDQVRMQWVNQYTNGCTVLQPIYVFNGNATLTTDQQHRFRAYVIAVPERPFPSQTPMKFGLWK